MRDWFLASNNPGKLARAAGPARAARRRARPQGELGIAEAEEPHPTFVENALAKARHAARRGPAGDRRRLRALRRRARRRARRATRRATATGAGSPREQVRPPTTRKLIAANGCAGAAGRRYYYCVAGAVRHADDPRAADRRGRWPGEMIARARAAATASATTRDFLPAAASDRCRADAGEKNADQPSRPGDRMR